MRRARSTAVVLAGLACLALGCGAGRVGTGTGGVDGGETGGRGSAGGLVGTGGDALASGGASAGGRIGSDGGGPGGAGPLQPLDMNDVTILVPLPATSEAPVLLRGSDLAADGTSFIPTELFQRLTKQSDGASPVASPLLAPETQERLQLMGVRFDLCDRHQPGECPAAEDARMRLVFQPVFTKGDVEDVGFHAFYEIRNDEISDAVGALRELARSTTPQSGALRVSPALSAAKPQPYATKLRAFVTRFGGQTRLVRLTINAQPETLAQTRWELRGVEKRSGQFVDIGIVGSTAISQSMILEFPSFGVTPPADLPAGLMGAISNSTFNSADAASRRASLTALLATENPLSHTAETTPCSACHASTIVLAQRLLAASIDATTLPGRYLSTYDTSIAGGTSAQAVVTRAFGYVVKSPLISQRVANETAQVLTEIAKRYPAQ